MDADSQEAATSPYPTVFTCERLNASTFLLIERDRYDEHPFVYVKIYQSPPLLLISDTGCGGDANPQNSPKDNLRTFIETYPVAANRHRPLNPRLLSGNPSLPYFIICTHCHFDHILGIPSFQPVSPGILASSCGRSFVEGDLPKHSLCSIIGVPTPKYVVSYWAEDMEEVRYEGFSLNIRILHTPGHTPDELAWFDEDERHLYVGDSFYERVARDKSYAQAIVFPKDGDVVQYMHSLAKMIDFVEEKNSEQEKCMVRLGSGHITSSVDALDMLYSIQQYLWDIINRKIPEKEAVEKRGELYGWWQEDGEPRFSLTAPIRLLVDARRHFDKDPHCGPGLPGCLGQG